MRIPKYFYVTSYLQSDHWVSVSGNLSNPNEFFEFIGGKYWPYTRDEARKCLVRDGTSFIYQFENKPPYKFIKQVR